MAGGSGAEICSGGKARAVPLTAVLACQANVPKRKNVASKIQLLSVPSAILIM